MSTKNIVIVRVILLLIAATILFASFSLAQEEINPSETSSNKKVTAIELRGNRSISTTTIISKIKIRVGQPYLTNIASDDLKRLYLLGYFSDVRIDTEDYKGGLKVIIQVTEKPIIEKITFSGMRRINITRTRENLKSKEGQYLDYPKINEDLIAIKELYGKRGFAEVTVDYLVDINKDTNKAKLNFVIQEGARVKIRSIDIEGNKSFSKTRILKLMKTKKAKLFSPGFFKEEVFLEDLERIKSFYQREGYSDVKVEVKKEYDSRRKRLYFTIKIDEGKKYIVGDVELRGNLNISTPEIKKKLTACIKGSVFSQERLRQDIANIQGIYFEKGYIFAQVKESFLLNLKTDRVDISYNIMEHEVAYVDKINVRGNTRTKDTVIRRELRIRPGDRFDGEKLKRSKERLQNLGFFEEIGYDIESAPTPNKQDLVIQVKEAKTGEFSFGGGYSSVDEFVGFIEIAQRNFDWKNFPYFTGDGQDLSLRAEMGTFSDEFDLSFTEPWIFDYPVSFGFDAYMQSHKRESDIGYGYDEDRRGGDIRLGKDLSEYLHLSSIYRFEDIEISNISTDASDELKKEEGKNTINSLGLTLSQDRRDNFFNPSKGSFLSGSVECAGGPFAGDKDFTKFIGTASKYFPLINNSVLELRLRLGLTDAFGDSTEVPIYERFFAGGANTIRGYNERKVGPIDPISEDPIGGGSMLIANVEYTFPLIEFVKLAVFYDTGNVWSKVGDLGSGGFKSAVGLGVRIKTPIGPIRLDYGYPLSSEPGEEGKSGKFHFSMSRGF